MLVDCCPRTGRQDDRPRMTNLLSLAAPEHETMTSGDERQPIAQAGLRRLPGVPYAGGVYVKSRTFPEQQQFNPRRKPTWRWGRAEHLVRAGQHMSKRRDDEATGIAVNYIREVNRSLSELRLRRVRERFRHVARAHNIWLSAGAEGVEIETRLLGRQNDAEIGLEMGLPAPTVQAYRDIFFHVDDRIDASSYILFQVIGMHPQRTPTPVQLMQASVYHHGPHVIEPWLQYLRDSHGSRDLTSAAGRMAESLDLLVSAHALPADLETGWSLARRLPVVFQTDWKFGISVSAARVFRGTTDALIRDLELPQARLEPFSYAPTTTRCQDGQETHKTR